MGANHKRLVVRIQHGIIRIHGSVVVIGDGGRLVFRVVIDHNRGAKRLGDVHLNLCRRFFSLVPFHHGSVGNAHVGHPEVAEVRVLEVLAVVQGDDIEAFFVQSCHQYVAE